MVWAGSVSASSSWLTASSSAADGDELTGEKVSMPAEVSTSAMGAGVAE